MINNFKDLPQYKALLSKGKAVGYLTFDEVNKALPPEFSAPEIFEDIIGHIEQHEIALVDTEKASPLPPETPIRRMILLTPSLTARSTALWMTALISTRI